jgi:hypothetical protein
MKDATTAAGDTVPRIRDRTAPGHGRLRVEVVVGVDLMSAAEAEDGHRRLALHAERPDPGHSVGEPAGQGRGRR